MIVEIVKAEVKIPMDFVCFAAVEKARAVDRNAKKGYNGICNNAEQEVSY